MTLSFAERLDHGAVVRAVDQLEGIVADAGPAWDGESALPGMTVGGLTRHLVSQPECAIEFLAIEPPPGRPTLSLADYFARLDWLHAPIGSPENTSIRDGFNAMAGPGHADSVAILDRARRDLPGAVAAAGRTTFVPWQGVALDTDDFLVVRLLEILVHADDLAVSLGQPTPTFGDEVVEPVAALLAATAVRRHGQQAVLRTLARRERATGPVSAFDPPS